MEHSRIPNDCVDSKSQQSGVALMVMLTLLALWGMYLFVGQLSATQYQAVRSQNAAAALAEAKQALIGDAISTFLISDSGFLRLPDLGQNASEVATEGNASLNFTGNNKDFSVIGKFPWKTLATSPLRDRYKECLWYVVSGRFKVSPPTDALNWDTQGQIDIIDGSGNLIATNLAALLVAPGPALDGQSRALANAVYVQCGGNYNAKNYLDAYDSANAIAGEVNYFSGSTNNRLAPGISNKRFVLAINDHYNDHFQYITVDDIFNPMIRRSDFAIAISSLLDYPAFLTHLQSITPTGSKGTDTLICNFAPNPIFCGNWKEMLFLTELSPPSPITIDGAPTANCSRVLIFAGRKIVGQSRTSIIDKANKINYLESANATSFSVPTATSSSFSGKSFFDWHNPGTDLVRCLP